MKFTPRQPSVGHAGHGDVAVPFGHFVDWNPTEVVGFFVDRVGFIADSLEGETDVKMQVGGVAFAFWETMNVDVENLSRNWLDFRQFRLFITLT